MSNAPIVSGSPLAFSPVIAIHHGLSEVAGPWAAFERDAASTLFQSLLWCRAWTETIGAAWGVSIRVVTLRNEAGSLLAILPLQIRRRHGVRVLEWLTAPHGSYGSGIFRADIAAQAGPWMERWWPHVAEQIGGFDAIALTDMPERLMGVAHPFTPLFNVTGANVSFAMNLGPDFDAIHARKRNGEDRRAARKKEEALNAQSPLQFGLPGSPAELHRTLEIMFEHQQGRLAERGVHGTFGPLERQFIHRLADLQDADRPELRPYRLVCGEDVLAVMLGGVHRNVFWALISSLAPGVSRKYSPGDIALRKTIGACCADGLSVLDFSAGDSPYKRAWADDIIGLKNLLAASNVLGLCWISVFAAGVTLKRLIKTHPAAFRLVQTLRRLLFSDRSLTR